MGLLAQTKTKAAERKPGNGTENGNQGIDWLVGNLNQIMTDLVLYPPDMAQGWRFSHEDPRGRLVVEFEPSKA